MNKYKILLICIFLTKLLGAQNLSPSQLENNCGMGRHNLMLGESVPKIFIPKIINNTFSKGYLQEFKENLIILDFWSIGCSSCIEKLPRLDSLQKIFQGQVKMLPVSFDPKESVEAFFKNNKYGKSTNLPSVVEDRNLSEWFKHYSISHMVWILNDKVVAITDPQYVTKSNIELILRGENPNWPVKNDGMIVDPTKPFIFSNKNPKILSYTTVSSFNDGNINGLDRISIIRDSTRKIIRSYIFNMDILASYRYIWWKLNKKIDNVVLDVVDKSNYIYSPANGTQAEWNARNAFCYEAEVPDNTLTIDQDYLILKADLDRVFNLETKIEKRLTKCLIMSVTKSKMPIKAEAGKFKIYKEGNITKFRSCPPSVILSYLKYSDENAVKIDESNFQGLIDMDIELQPFMDISVMNKILEKYGLILRIEDRSLDTFIIKEIK